MSRLELLLHKKWPMLFGLRYPNPKGQFGTQFSDILRNDGAVCQVGGSVIPTKPTGLTQPPARPHLRKTKTTSCHGQLLKEKKKPSGIQCNKQALLPGTPRWAVSALHLSWLRPSPIPTQNWNNFPSSTRRLFMLESQGQLPKNFSCACPPFYIR